MKYVGFITFAVCFVFVVLIINDVLKAEYYRNSLETANETIHNNALQKERFLYSVSHELRTPLTAILGFSEQISRMELKPKAKQYNHIILNATNHLLDTVNEVLDIAKVESGKLAIHNQELYLPTFVSGINDFFKIDAEEKGIDFTIDMAKVYDEEIYIDPFRLRQIFINLISNALKFTDKGCVKVTISQKSNMLSIVVYDTGRGIEDSKRNQIFEEYVQVGTNDWLGYKGTGLGLSITKKIVEAMRGKIGVESQVLKGSSFKVELPYTAYKGGGKNASGSNKIRKNGFGREKSSCR